MATVVQPDLRLQAKHTNRPYGGGWWPGGDDVSHQILDLMGRWPADRPSIVSYAFLQDNWDSSESEVPSGNLTRTLVLILSDRSSCRLLLLPADTNADVADEFLTEASDPLSKWRRMDFASTYRSAKPPVALK